LQDRDEYGGCGAGLRLRRLKRRWERKKEECMPKKKAKTAKKSKAKRRHQLRRRLSRGSSSSFSEIVGSFSFSGERALRARRKALRMCRRAFLFGASARAHSAVIRAGGL
jgi:hypothetical protein